MSLGGLPDYDRLGQTLEMLEDLGEAQPPGAPAAEPRRGLLAFRGSARGDRSPVGLPKTCGARSNPCPRRWRGERRLGPVRLRMPGRHHALNALAALAVAEDLEIPFRIAVHALEEFGGIHRRFEVKGEEQGVLVVDDYGHHPEEIRATLRAAREGFPRRLVVAFQPHRYTRTRDLFNEFLEAFDDADALVLTDIYPAGEERIEGVWPRPSTRRSGGA